MHPARRVPEVVLQSRLAPLPHSPDREEVVDRALEIFQPRTDRVLTREDGREIARNLTGFFRVLWEWRQRELAAQADDATAHADPE